MFVCVRVCVCVCVCVHIEVSKFVPVHMAKVAVVGVGSVVSLGLEMGVNTVYHRCN